MEEEGFTLDEWIGSKPEAYELSQEQLDQLQDLLAPAASKCQELGIPYTFAYQGALRDNGLECSINGLVFSPKPERVGPNALLNHLLFNRHEPGESVMVVSSAVASRKDNDKGVIVL